MFFHTSRRAVGSARWISVSLMAAALAACGGGGGGSNPAPTYSVGGNVSGLATGASLVLQNAGGNNLTVTANGAFTFTNLLSSGASYSVTVATQPASPSQTCTVTSGSGTISGNVSNVAVACVTNNFAIGGTVSGLTGTGLVLQRNGANNLAVTANGNYAFPAVASGTAYTVTVLTQPSNPAQTCTVANGTGTVGTAAVTNVAITCSTATYTVGGTVTGLAGTGLVLQNNGGGNLTVSANGAFTFAAAVASGSAYAVTVQTQPSGPTQVCSVSNGSGTITNANVTNVAVNCAASTYTVSGTIAGYSGSGMVLQLNGANNLAVASGLTSFSFATTPLNSGSNYAVTVSTQPTGPSQTCTVANGSGTGTANVTNVAITCATASYTIGGTVSGLSTATGLGAGAAVVLRNNGGNDLTVSANGNFTFTTPVASGGAYAVTVQTSPTAPARTCLVTAGGTGTVATANVTNVVVNCRSKYMFQANNQGDDSITSYSVDATTGAITLVDHETRAPDDVTGVAVTPSGDHVFISLDKAAPANGAIATYLVNADGTLTWTGTDVTLPVGIDPTGANPKTILVSPNGQHVYVFDGPNGAIHHYTFVAATSTLTFVGTESVLGLVAVHMDPTGRFLYAGSWDDRNVSTFLINQSTGALTLAAFPPTVVGTQGSELTLNTDAAGRFLFVGNQRDAAVKAYRINATTGDLTFEESESTASPPVTPGPVSTVVDPSGLFLYTALTDHTVLAFSINQTSGALTPLVNNPFSTQAPSGLTGVDFKLGIDASGQYLYQTSYTDGLMIVYSVNRTTGALTEVVGPAISPWPFPVYEGVTGIAFE